MKLAIVGSRSFTDYTYFKECMKQFENSEISYIISGGAVGADTLAEKYAAENNIPVKIFYPDYNLHGKKAPILRNTTIVENSDVVVAFWNGVSGGTRDSINKARKLKKAVVIFRVDGLSTLCL